MNPASDGPERKLPGLYLALYLLADVSKNGIEFRVTCRPVGNLPKCSLPPGAKFSRVSEPQEAGFQWNHSAFVCPCCGETFLFQRPAKLTIGS